MNDLISRKALIAEYDRVHIGPPGGARNLMEDAPAAVVHCKDCKHWFAEEPERCKKMVDKPYGWCCRARSICDTDYTDNRYYDDFCSYGERKDNYVKD